MVNGEADNGDDGDVHADSVLHVVTVTYFKVSMKLICYEWELLLVAWLSKH
jgi:hypothetical protein